MTETFIDYIRRERERQIAQGYAAGQAFGPQAPVPPAPAPNPGRDWGVLGDALHVGAEGLGVLGRVLDVGNKFVTRPVGGAVMQAFDGRENRGESFTETWNEGFEGHPWLKLGAEVVFDPLNLVGVGLVGKVGKLGKLDDAYRAGKTYQKTLDKAITADRVADKVMSAPVAVPWALTKGGVKKVAPNAFEKAESSIVKGKQQIFDTAVRALGKAALRPEGNVTGWTDDLIVTHLAELTPEERPAFLATLNPGRLGKLAERDQHLKPEIDRVLTEQGYLRPDGTKTGRLVAYERAEALADVKGWGGDERQLAKDLFDVFARVLHNSDPARFRSIDDAYRVVEALALFDARTRKLRLAPKNAPDLFRGFYDPNTNAVALSPLSNATTLLHELLGHAVRDFLGETDDTLVSETGEAFAEGVENFFRTGTMPHEVRDLFERLREHTGEVYRTGTPNAALSDVTRGVLTDRLRGVASDRTERPGIEDLESSAVRFPEPLDTTDPGTPALPREAFRQGNRAVLNLNWLREQGALVGGRVQTPQPGQRPTPPATTGTPPNGSPATAGDLAPTVPVEPTGPAVPSGGQAVPPGAAAPGAGAVGPLGDPTQTILPGMVPTPRTTNGKKAATEAPITREELADEIAHVRGEYEARLAELVEELSQSTNRIISIQRTGRGKRGTAALLRKEAQRNRELREAIEKLTETINETQLRYENAVTDAHIASRTAWENADARSAAETRVHELEAEVAELKQTLADMRPGTPGDVEELQRRLEALTTEYADLDRAYSEADAARWQAEGTAERIQRDLDEISVELDTYRTTHGANAQAGLVAHDGPLPAGALTPSPWEELRGLTPEQELAELESRAERIQDVISGMSDPGELSKVLIEISDRIDEVKRHINRSTPAGATDAVSAAGSDLANLEAEEIALKAELEEVAQAKATAIGDDKIKLITREIKIKDRLKKLTAEIEEAKAAAQEFSIADGLTRDAVPGGPSLDDVDDVTYWGAVESGSDPVTPTPAQRRKWFGTAEKVQSRRRENNKPDYQFLAADPTTGSLKENNRAIKKRFDELVEAGVVQPVDEELYQSFVSNLRNAAQSRMRQQSDHFHKAQKENAFNSLRISLAQIRDRIISDLDGDEQLVALAIRARQDGLIKNINALGEMVPTDKFWSDSVKPLEFKFYFNPHGVKPDDARMLPRDAYVDATADFYTRPGEYAGDLKWLHTNPALAPIASEGLSQDAADTAFGKAFGIVYRDKAGVPHAFARGFWGTTPDGRFVPIVSMMGSRDGSLASARGLREIGKVLLARDADPGSGTVSNMTAQLLHHLHVEKAVQEGLPVSADALASYPKLGRKAREAGLEVDHKDLPEKYRVIAETLSANFGDNVAGEAAVRGYTPRARELNQQRHIPDTLDDEFDFEVVRPGDPRLRGLDMFTPATPPVGTTMPMIRGSIETRILDAQSRPIEPTFTTVTTGEPEWQFRHMPDGLYYLQTDGASDWHLLTIENGEMAGLPRTFDGNDIQLDTLDWLSENPIGRGSEDDLEFLEFEVPEIPTVRIGMRDVPMNEVGNTELELIAGRARREGNITLLDQVGAEMRRRDERPRELQFQGINRSQLGAALTGRNVATDAAADRFYRKLTPEEDAAVEEYRAGKTSWINGLLRGETRTHTGETIDPLVTSRFIDNLSKAIEKTEPLQQPMTVYRGLKYVSPGLKQALATLKPGDVIRDRGFVSTSESFEQSAARFIDPNNPVFLIIDLPAGTKAAPLKTQERELLLPAGAAFRVKSVERSTLTGETYIEVDYVGKTTDDAAYQWQGVQTPLDDMLSKGDESGGLVDADAAVDHETLSPLASDATTGDAVNRIAYTAGIKPGSSGEAHVREKLTTVLGENPHGFQAIELARPEAADKLARAMRSAESGNLDEADALVAEAFDAINQQWVAFGIRHPMLHKIIGKIPGLAPEIKQQVTVSGRDPLGTTYAAREVAVLQEARELKQVQQYQARYDKTRELAEATIADLAQDPRFAGTGLISEVTDATTIRELREVVGHLDPVKDANKIKTLESFLKVAGAEVEERTLKEVNAEGLIETYHRAIAKHHGVDYGRPPKGVKKGALLVMKGWREQALLSPRYLLTNGLDMIVRSSLYGSNPVKGRGADLELARYGVTIPTDILVRGHETTGVREGIDDIGGRKPVLGRIPKVGKPLGKAVEKNWEINAAVENAGRKAAFRKGFADHIEQQVLPRFTAEIRRVLPDDVQLTRSLEASRGAMSPESLYKTAIANGATAEQAAELARIWQKHLTEATERGREIVNKIFFPYDGTDVRKIEETLKVAHWMPFHFWATRNIPFYLDTLSQQPELLRLWQTYDQVSDDHKEAAGLTASKRGFLPVDVPLLDVLFGPGTGYFNPLVALSIADQTKPRYTPDDATGLGKGLNEAGRLGLNLAPWIVVPLTLGGVYGDRNDAPDLLRHSGLVEGVTGHNPERPVKELLDQVQERVTGKEKVTLTGSAYKDFLVSNRIAEMSLEETGRANHPAYVEALANPRSPIFQRALAEIETKLFRNELYGFVSPIPMKHVPATELSIRKARKELADQFGGTAAVPEAVWEQLRESGHPALGYGKVGGDARGRQIWAGLSAGDGMLPGWSQMARQQAMSSYPAFADYLQWRGRQPSGADTRVDTFLKST